MSATDRATPRLGKLEPESGRPGVVLQQADFRGRDPAAFPFEGGRFTVEPGCTSRPDTHAVRECWMVAQGRGRLVYDGCEHDIEEGDFLYFEPLKTHQVHNTGDRTLVIHTVWWSA